MEELLEELLKQAKDWQLTGASGYYSQNGLYYEAMEDCGNTLEEIVLKYKEKK